MTRHGCSRHRGRHRPRAVQPENSDYSSVVYAVDSCVCRRSIARYSDCCCCRLEIHRSVSRRLGRAGRMLARHKADVSKAYHRYCVGLSSKWRKSCFWCVRSNLLKCRTGRFFWSPNDLPRHSWTTAMTQAESMDHIEMKQDCVTRPT